MNAKLVYTLVAVIAMVVGFVAAKHWRERAAPAPAAVSTVAPVLSLPEFSLKNRAGELQSIHSWPGKSLMINFWATWCAPCRREIPLLNQLQQQYAAQGVQVVGIAVDFRDEVLKFTEQLPLHYPLLIGEQDGLAAVDAFGIRAVGFPYTVFTDAQGNIVTTHIGELHREQAVAVLDIIEDINQGRLSLNAARTAVAAKLADLNFANDK